MVPVSRFDLRQVTTMPDRMTTERVDAAAILSEARSGRRSLMHPRIEYRFTMTGSHGRPSLRAATTASEDSVEGYGAIFNSETTIAGLFRERVRPGAFKASIARDDIRVALNHDANHIIGRSSAGTAEFSEDRHGLKYIARTPDTTWARDL